MMVWRHIAAALESGAPCALVTVAHAGGSTPREQGARMVVRPDGSFSGTIGGGTLEFQAIGWAVRALDEEQTGLALRTVSLGPDLGQCCGGRVDVAIEAIAADQLETARILAALEADGLPFATIAETAAGQPVERRILERVPAGGAPFELENTILTERFGECRQPVWLFGAGHVGKALMLAMAPLPFQLTWIDSRPEMFPSAVPGSVTKVASPRPAELLEGAPSGALIVVMTHSHALDEEIVAAALAQQRFYYVGVIGSKTKRARFRSRLEKRGLSAGLINKMTCPIGAGGVQSKHPAAIAAGVVVELMRVSETSQAVDEQDFALAE